MKNMSDIIKALPGHERKLAKKMLNNLFKAGFLNRKKGIKYEYRYSLNVERKNEIEKTLYNK